MSEKNQSVDNVIGELVLPTPPAIGVRNAALGGTTPQMGAISIIPTWVPPGTISLRKPND
ncbi:hypothetical protein [Actinophytocola sp.]|uniref:hypothetical protein n=1 Tax=Actinophytocola sp. TaxID=1872138 RepID=UPI002ED4CFDB